MPQQYLSLSVAMQFRCNGACSSNMPAFLVQNSVSITLFVYFREEKKTCKFQISNIKGNSIVRNLINVIETFLHRLMASTLHFKNQNGASFLLRMPFLLYNSEEDTSKRKFWIISYFLNHEFGYFQIMFNHHFWLFSLWFRIKLYRYLEFYKSMIWN